MGSHIAYTVEPAKFVTRGFGAGAGEAMGGLRARGDIISGLSLAYDRRVKPSAIPPN